MNKLAPSDIPITSLLPHAGRMCLLQRLLEANEDSAVAECIAGADDLFVENGVVGAWVGLEYLAQTAAAWAGWQQRCHDLPPQVGFLLGARRFESSVDHFVVNSRLLITLQREQVADNGLSKFIGQIVCDGERVVTATLSIFVPPVTTDNS